MPKPPDYASQFWDRCSLLTELLIPTWPVHADRKPRTRVRAKFPHGVLGRIAETHRTTGHRSVQHSAPFGSCRLPRTCPAGGAGARLPGRARSASPRRAARVPQRHSRGAAAGRTFELVDHRSVTTLPVTHCRGGIELADRLLLSVSSARILADVPVARPRVPHTAAELAALRKETARVSLIR